MIYIIGGSGFIGTYLGKNLNEEGIPFTILDKQTSVTFPEHSRKIDIRQATELDAFKRQYANDIVILLAAEHADNVSPIDLYYDVNVTGTQNVLRWMEKEGIRNIIFTSSVAIYGLNKPNPTEDHQADPFNHYGKSKWEAENVLREWYQKDPEKHTLNIIRPTVVFGPGNKGNVYNLLKQIVSGKFLRIGSGENKKSMAYVENVSGFIKYLCTANIFGYHVYNYVDKPDLSMNELIVAVEGELGKKVSRIKVPYAIGYLGGLGFDALAFLTRKKLPISAVRVKKFCATTQFADNALKQSGYVPKCTIAEGLAKTIASIQKDTQEK